MVIFSETDAQIIRTIHDLYKMHVNIRVVKTEADKQGLRTAIRKLSSGRLKAELHSAFGHIYYIVCNPIYAGRIRHKAKVWPGQHPPLIDPTDWDAVQEQLKAGAVVPRLGKGRSGEGGKTHVSLLAGKVFDETGDRLTADFWRNPPKCAQCRRLGYSDTTKYPGNWSNIR